MIDVTAGRRPDVDVLIVGAGPTGLTLAAQLHQFGVQTRIVDRLENLVHESRALAIQPRSLEVLDAIGIAEPLIERGNDAVEVRLHAGPRVVPLRLFDVGLHDTAYPFLLFLSQAETERVLADHLAANGVRVERGVELTEYTAGDEAVACGLRHGDGRTEAVRAAYLVGCDGAHSTVRDVAGIPFEGAAYPQTFVLADLEVEGELERDRVHVYIGAHGMLFFFPLGQPSTWRVQSMLPRDDGAGDHAHGSRAPSLGELQAIADTFTGGRLRLRDPKWFTRFRIHHRHAASYRAGRIFLAGDAAHVHSPAGAQGMNTGIQDACNLGWKLAWSLRGRVRAAVLESYEAERRPVGSSVLRFSDRPFSIATSTGPLFRFVRTHVVPRVASLAVRFDAPRAYVYRRLAQLEVRYRSSPITHEGAPPLRHGPMAGDRLPDAALTREGRSVSLQRELSGPSLHLLLCGPVRAWDPGQLSTLREHLGTLLATHHLASEPSTVTLADESGEALVRLGVEQEGHYLVRPDGHVAYRAAGTDLEPMARWLHEWVIGPEPLP